MLQIPRLPKRVYAGFEPMPVEISSALASNELEILLLASRLSTIWRESLIADQLTPKDSIFSEAAINRIHHFTPTQAKLESDALYAAQKGLALVVQARITSHGDPRPYRRREDFAWPDSIVGYAVAQLSGADSGEGYPTERGDQVYLRRIHVLKDFRRRHLGAYMAHYLASHFPRGTGLWTSIDHRQLPETTRLALSQGFIPGNERSGVYLGEPTGTMVDFDGVTCGDLKNRMRKHREVKDYYKIPAEAA